MKFKFRVDKDDLKIFLIFAIFLLYIVAIGIVNLATFAKEGHLSGINPFPAFGPEYIMETLLIYLFPGVPSFLIRTFISRLNPGMEI